MPDQMNPMGPVEPEIMSQDSENVIGLPPGQADREGAMAKADLYKIANYSHKLFKQINDDDQMEAWVQAKITKAADYIASVYHYLEYEMKFSQYGKALEDSEVYSESQKRIINNRLMEAKSKVKELKKVHAEKIKADADDKIAEGILSGGHRECTECGGSGMVYEEPKAIPDHVKSKVEKYNRQAKAFHAASKRLDRNQNGIPDDEEVDEDFDANAKVGSTKKTATGELTKTDTGVIHKNTSYKDDGDELDSMAKSGKGKASHAKAQSAEEKAKRAPAQKQSPKSAKTWGMKDSEKFDNRDGAPAKPKKAKEVDETYGTGVYEAKKKGDGNLANNAKPYDKVTRGDVIAGRLGKDEKGGKVKEAKEEKFDALKHVKNPTKGEKDAAKDVKRGSYADRAAMLKSAEADGRLKEASKPSAGLSKAKKSAVVKDAKAGKDIGKPGKSFDKVAKAAGGGEKGEKIAAAAMWKNIKETQAYIAEKKKVADEGGNEFVGKLKKAREEGDTEMTVGGKTVPVKPGKPIPESADLTRMKQFLTRLNG